jgi:hypothetical protein
MKNKLGWLIGGLTGLLVAGGLTVAATGQLGNVFENVENVYITVTGSDEVIKEAVKEDDTLGGGESRTNGGFSSKYHRIEDYGTTTSDIFSFSRRLEVAPGAAQDSWRNDMEVNVIACNWRLIANGTATSTRTAEAGTSTASVVSDDYVDPNLFMVNSIDISTSTENTIYESNLGNNRDCAMVKVDEYINLMLRAPVSCDAATDGNNGKCEAATSTKHDKVDLFVDLFSTTTPATTRF